MNDKNEDARVQEDAVRIQENNVQDVANSVEFETKKISFALAFLSIVVVQSLDFIAARPLEFKVAFILVVGAALISTILSLFAKKIDMHTNVEEIFVNQEENSNWSQYLDNRHLNLNDIKKNLDDFLKTKVFYTKITFVLTGLSVLILLSGVFL